MVLAQLLAGIGSLALLAAWLAPNHYPPWTSFHGEAAAFAGLCGLVLARTLQPQPARLGAWSGLAAFLLALVAIQWATGRIAYGGDAFLSGMYIAGAALAAWLGANTQERARPDALTWLAALLVAGAVVSVFIGVLQWHRLEQALGVLAAERGPDMRVYANIGQPNHLGTLCLMATALSGWLWLQGHLRRWQFLLLLAWLALGVTMTESRSAVVGAAALGLLLLSRRRLVPGVGLLLAAWWGLLLAGRLAWPGLNELLHLQLLQPPSQLGQDNLRLTMWTQALHAIAAAPWFGHGWHQTMLALKAASLEVPGRLATDYAHNFVLDLYVWVGVPLATALLALAGWWLWRSWRRIADARQLVMLAALVPFLVHSAFEFPFAYSYFLFPAAWLCGALGARQAAPAAAAPHRRRDVRLPMLACTAAFAVLAAQSALEYMEVEEDYRVMRFELRRVGQVPVGHEAPELVLLTQLGELLELGRLEPKPGMDPRTIERLGVLSARQGWATLDLTYAAALGLNGQPEAAARQLALLRSVYGEASARQAYEMFEGFAGRYPQLRQVPIPH